MIACVRFSSPFLLPFLSFSMKMRGESELLGVAEERVPLRDEKGEMGRRSRRKDFVEHNRW